MSAALPRVAPAVLRFAQLAITVVVLVTVWRLVDGPQISEAMRGVQPIWLVFGFSALSVQTVLSAMRWRITAGQLGLELGLREAVREYYLSQIINQTIPGGVVGDASRAVRSRAQRGLIASSQAVIFERLAGQAALFLVLTIAFAVTFCVPGGLDWPLWTIPIVLVILGGGFGAVVLFLIAASVPHALGAKASSLARTMGHAIAGRDVVFVQVALSLGTTFCNLAAFAFCARSVGIVPTPAMVFALIPMILFTMLVPLTIMGWGLREGAAAALLPLVGATTSAAFAASVAFGMTMLVATLPGLLTVWLRRTPKHKDISA